MKKKIQVEISKWGDVELLTSGKEDRIFLAFSGGTFLPGKAIIPSPT